MEAYQLKITLKDSHPPIWRRVMVPVGLNFSQLSIIINETMGWNGSHLCNFELPGKNVIIEDKPGDDDIGYGMMYRCYPANTTYLTQILAEKVKLLYTYDFGDNWEHIVLVEKIVPDYPHAYPQVIKFKGDCPPEDSGGIYGYYNALDNPDDEYDINEYIQTYDLSAVNAKLEDCFTINPSKIDKRTIFQLYEDIFGKAKFGLNGKIPAKAKGKLLHTPPKQSKTAPDEQDIGKIFNNFFRQFSGKLNNRNKF